MSAHTHHVEEERGKKKLKKTAANVIAAAAKGSIITRSLKNANALRKRFSRVLSKSPDVRCERLASLRSERIFKMRCWS
jgi:hypothetical protein